MEHARNQETILRDASEVFQVPVEELPATASRFFTEWKDQRKRIEALEARNCTLANIWWWQRHGRGKWRPSRNHGS